MNAKRAGVRPPHRPVFRPVPPIEWAQDFLPGEVRLTAVGRRCVLVENYASLLCYTDEAVRLFSRDGEISVSGENLTLSDIRPGELVIRGKIDSVTLSGHPHA